MSFAPPISSSSSVTLPINESNVTNLVSDLSLKASVSSVTTNTTAIATNSTAIAANTTAIAANTSTLLLKAPIDSPAFTTSVSVVGTVKTSGASGALIVIGRNGSAGYQWYCSNQNDGLRLYDRQSGSTPMRIDSNGNLSVSGGIAMSGTFAAGQLQSTGTDAGVLIGSRNGNAGYQWYSANSGALNLYNQSTGNVGAIFTSAGGLTLTGPLNTSGGTIRTGDGSGVGGGNINMDGGILNVVNEIIGASGGLFLNGGDANTVNIIQSNLAFVGTAGAYQFNLNGNPIVGVGYIDMNGGSIGNFSNLTGSSISINGGLVMGGSNISGVGAIDAVTLSISGALTDGTYTCGSGSITIANGVITAIS